MRLIQTDWAFLIFASAREADTLPAFGFERREDGGLIRRSDEYFSDFRSATAAFVSLTSATQHDYDY